MFDMIALQGRVNTMHNSRIGLILFCCLHCKGFIQWLESATLTTYTLDIHITHSANISGVVLKATKVGSMHVVWFPSI